MFNAFERQAQREFGHLRVERRNIDRGDRASHRSR